MEKLYNTFLKIVPLEHKTLLPGESTTYNEIGTVVAKDKSVIGIKIGDKVRFDRFLAYKFPREGDDNEFDWYVKFSEVISSDAGS